MKRLKKFVSFAKKAAPYRNIFLQSVDLFVHKIRINTNFGDYYRFEFYKKGKTWEEKSRYVGMDGSMYYPYENNPLKFLAVLTDKYIQKTLFLGFGLPTPELIAAIGECYEIKTEEQFYSVFEKVDFDVLFKPISSMGGGNILLLEYRDKSFFLEGKPISLAEVWKQIVSKDLNSGYLIEKRVFNTPEVQELHPFSLNTYRVVTVKTNDNQWHICPVIFKIGAGKRAVDNIGIGGIEMLIDEERRFYAAYLGKNIIPITHHPDTGKDLIGFKAVGYQEVIDLAIKASKKFGFMGTIGWDIAFTTEGPMVIEANSLWGTNYPPALGGFISDEMAEGLKKHHIFSRWDKTKMYPKFHRKSRLPWKKNPR